MSSVGPYLYEISNTRGGRPFKEDEERSKINKKCRGGTKKIGELANFAFWQIGWVLDIGCLVFQAATKADNPNRCHINVVPVHCKSVGYMNWSLSNILMLNERSDIIILAK